MWQVRAPTPDLIKQLEPIAQALADGLRVMIYCRSGKNRSPSLACLVLLPVIGDIDATAEWIHGLRGLC